MGTCLKRQQAQDALHLAHASSRARFSIILRWTYSSQVKGIPRSAQSP